MSKFRRAVGYCLKVGCEKYQDGAFLIDFREKVYRCKECGQSGFFERERGSYEGESDLFGEVRVMFNFDLTYRTYMESAAVRDLSLGRRHSIYTLKSPLIKTETRALKVAEAILSNLNRYRGIAADNEDNVPGYGERILSFDDTLELFSSKLNALAAEWR